MEYSLSFTRKYSAIKVLFKMNNCLQGPLDCCGGRAGCRGPPMSLVASRNPIFPKGLLSKLVRSSHDMVLMAAGKCQLLHRIKIYFNIIYICCVVSGIFPGSTGHQALAHTYSYTHTLKWGLESTNLTNLHVHCEGKPQCLVCGLMH